MFSFKKVENTAEIKAWHKVCDLIYNNDPNYIYPITKDVENIFNPQTNIAYKEGECERYLVQDGQGKNVARFAVFWRELKPGKKYGGMGFFECIDNKDLAFQIFDFCKDWVKQHGCKFMDGPINFGDRDIFWGLLIEMDPRTWTSFRESYNPKYYQSFFEEYGFEKIIEQSTQEMTEEDFNFERFSKLAERVTSNPAYEFKYIDYSQPEKMAEEFCYMYNQAWSTHEEFKPQTIEQIKQRIKDLKPVAPSEIVIFAYYEGKPIGFYVNILEINMIFRKFKGDFGLINKLRFLLSKNKIHKVKGLIFGIIPEFRNKGIETGLIMKFHETVKNFPKYTTAELAWIGDFNPRMLSMLESLGAWKSKLHYTYRLNLE